jgi:hypothetical protein
VFLLEEGSEVEEVVDGVVVMGCGGLGESNGVYLPLWMRTATMSESSV